MKRKQCTSNKNLQNSITIINIFGEQLDLWWNLGGKFLNLFIMHKTSKGQFLYSKTKKREIDLKTEVQKTKEMFKLPKQSM